MNKTDLEQLRKQVEAEYRRKLDAINVVWELVQNANGHLEIPEPPRDESKPTRSHGIGLGKGELVGAVRETLPSLHGSFTIKDVIRALEVTNKEASTKRSSLASSLRRLVDSGEIHIEAQGVGRKPSTYRRSSK